MHDYDDQAVWDARPTPLRVPHQRAQTQDGWYGTAFIIAIGLLGLWALYGMMPFS